MDVLDLRHPASGRDAERATSADDLVGEVRSAQRAREAQPSVHERDEPERERATGRPAPLGEILLEAGAEVLDLLREYPAMLAAVVPISPTTAGSGQPMVCSSR